MVSGGIWVATIHKLPKTAAVSAKSAKKASHFEKAEERTHGLGTCRLLLRQSGNRIYFGGSDFT